MPTMPEEGLLAAGIVMSLLGFGAVVWFCVERRVKRDTAEFMAKPKYRTVPNPSGGWELQIRCPVLGYRGVAMVDSNEEVHTMIQHLESNPQYFHANERRRGNAKNG